MSTFGGILSIARSAISAHQAAIQVVSHNIANAETPGYSRQRAELQEGWPERLPQGNVGTGVFVRDVSQMRDTLLDGSYRRDTSNAGFFGLRRDLLGQVEQIVHEPSDNGLAASLDAFWNSWADLANAPNNPAARQVVQQRGAQVAGTLNAFAARLNEVQSDSVARLNEGVDQINRLATQVAELNGQIVAAESGGKTAGDLRDTRNLLVDQMSSLADVRVDIRADGAFGITVANQTLVDGTAHKAIEVRGTPPSLQLGFVGSSGDPLPPVGGELGALRDVLNRDIPQTRQQLDSLASGVVSAVNTAHEKGWSPAAEPGPPPAPSGWAGSNVDFFDPAGVTAASIQLSSAVAGDKNMIASGAVFGGTGDNATALEMAALRDTAVSVGGTTTTLAGYYRNVVSTVALNVNSADSSAAVHETLAAQSDQRRQSVSGVSTDEELVQLMRSQQAYVAATRLVSAVDEMAQALLNMV